MKNLYLLLFLQCCFVSNIYAQYPFGEINGTVTDAESGETIPFVNLTIEGNGTIVETITDFSGSYSVKGLPTGLYSLNLSYVGCASKSIHNVLVKGGDNTSLDISLGCFCCVLGGYEVIEYREPQLRKTPNTNKTFTRKEIHAMPFRNTNDIAGMGTNSFDIR